MNNLACNRLLLGSMTLWSLDFSLDLEIEVICSLNPVCISINVWALMAEMLG